MGVKKKESIIWNWPKKINYEPRSGFEQDNIEDRQREDQGTYYPATGLRSALCFVDNGLDGTDQTGQCPGHGDHYRDHPPGPAAEEFNRGGHNDKKDEWSNER